MYQLAQCGCCLVVANGCFQCADIHSNVLDIIVANLLPIRHLVLANGYHQFSVSSAIYQQMVAINANDATNSQFFAARSWHIVT